MKKRLRFEAANRRVASQRPVFKAGVDAARALRDREGREEHAAVGVVGCFSKMVWFERLGVGRKWRFGEEMCRSCVDLGLHRGYDGCCLNTFSSAR
jgi:hypothetical protein